MARSHLRLDSSLDSCAQTVEDQEPNRFCCGDCAWVHTMNVPHVIVGDFNMTPDELIATQWVDQLRGQIVTPQETVSTCSNGGRTIDFAVISGVLARNVELTVDLEAPFAPHCSLRLKLHMSISQVTMTTQLPPPAMPWKPEKDITPECANEIWSGIESLEPFRARQQSTCSVLKAPVVYQSFGAISSLMQPKHQNWLKRLSTYWTLRHDMREPPDLSAAKAPHWLEHTRCGRPRIRETSVTGRFFWRAHRLSTVCGVRRSPQVFTHRCSVKPARHLQSLEEVTLSMPHATPKR